MFKNYFKISEVPVTYQYECSSSRNTTGKHQWIFILWSDRHKLSDSPEEDSHIHRQNNKYMYYRLGPKVYGLVSFDLPEI